MSCFGVLQIILQFRKSKLLEQEKTKKQDTQEVPHYVVFIKVEPVPGLSTFEPQHLLAGPASCWCPISIDKQEYCLVLRKKIFIQCLQNVGKTHQGKLTLRPHCTSLLSHWRNEINSVCRALILKQYLGQVVWHWKASRAVTHTGFNSLETPALWLWANQLTSIKCSFLQCKMDLVRPNQICWECLVKTIKYLL